MSVRMAAMGIIALGVSGCGDPVEGFVWEVTLTGSTDTCNEQPLPYRETFDYVLDLYSPPTATIGLDNDVFATGRVSGSNIDYSSVIWTEDRGGYEIRWQITGNATFRLGGTTTDLPDGIDWEGSEVFEIMESADPDLEEGCIYALDAEGTYQGEL